MSNKLLTYLRDMSLAERDALAERARQNGLRCSGGHITNVAMRSRNASKSLVKFIVTDSGGRLKPRHGIEYLYEQEA